MPLRDNLTVVPSLWNGCHKIQLLGGLCLMAATCSLLSRLRSVGLHLDPSLAFVFPQLHNPFPQVLLEQVQRRCRNVFVFAI